MPNHGLRRFDMDHVWADHLLKVAATGQVVTPRGRPTRECYHETITVSMRQPVVTWPERKLSYQYMAAEAYWILSGDNTVAGIAPFNSKIADYSDDGVTFFGAYGPPIRDQMDYVVRTLVHDRESRQAGLTIWRPNPPRTKDVPCTIAMFFHIRHGALQMSVYMRSSDVWLGLPYDVFAFSMVGHAVCAQYNALCARPSSIVTPGLLSLTAASSHLYMDNHAAATPVLHAPRCPDAARTPDVLWSSHGALLQMLDVLRHTRPGDPNRWWEVRP